MSSRSPGFLAGPDDWLDLDDVERAERTAALSAITRARREGGSVEDAAADLGIGMNVVRWWADEALGPTIGGTTRPTPIDDLLRIRPIGLDGEINFAGLLGSDHADRAWRIFTVQYDYAHGRASADDLRALPATFAGRRVIRDPRELDELARRDEFSVEEIYRDLVG